MAEITYQLERFDGPLDLLLNLIHKNKVNIADIPIALICDQYLAYLRAAERMNMELTSDFIVMASELMLIKSKMLLPRKEPDKEDPRQELAQLLVLYQQAKDGARLMTPMYAFFSGRMVKDTDEISPDRTFASYRGPERFSPGSHLCCGSGGFLAGNRAAQSCFGIQYQAQGRPCHLHPYDCKTHRVGRGQNCRNPAPYRT